MGQVLLHNTCTVTQHVFGGSYCVCCYMYYRCPQWSEDEQLCTRSVANEVHCYEEGRPGEILALSFRSNQ